MISIDELKLYIVSDSLGETGTMVAKAAISQFNTDNYKIKRYPYIDSREKLLEVLKKASNDKYAVLIYTIVSKELIQVINKFAETEDLLTIDLMSPLLDALSSKLDKEPTRESGAIRKLDEAYFNRVAAIEFAVKYDDGKDPQGLIDADLVLLGVSRTSKTPLSMYLANKNIKVANVPLVLEVDPPEEIYKISSRKIIGLTNSPEKLNEIREERLKALGVTSSSDYACLSRILDELDFADKIMKRIGCPIIDVSNKAIEETAGIVISALNKNGIYFE